MFILLLISCDFPFLIKDHVGFVIKYAILTVSFNNCNSMFSFLTIIKSSHLIHFTYAFADDREVGGKPDLCVWIFKQEIDLSSFVFIE